MQIAIVKIEGLPNEAVYLDGKLIASADPSIGESQDIISKTASSLASSLNIEPVILIAEVPKDKNEWCWNDIQEILLKNGSLIEDDAKNSISYANKKDEKDVFQKKPNEIYNWNKVSDSEHNPLSAYSVAEKGDMELLRQMYQLQNAVNIQEYGENWMATGTTRDGGAIDWHRLAYMEAAEAMSCLSWRPWEEAGSEVDMDNIKIKFANIIRFMLSQDLINRGGNVEECVSVAYGSYLAAKFEEKKGLIDALDRIITYCANKVFVIDYLFEALVQVPEFDLFEIYELHHIKSCLNQFRQDNGYRDNTYIKIWDGREDTAWAQEFSKFGYLTYDEIYFRLNSIYIDIKDSNKPK